MKPWLGVVFFMLISVPAVGQGLGSQVGLLYGFSVPDADNTTAHQMYGIKGSAFFSPILSLGGYYWVTGSPQGGGGRQFDYSIHGIDLAYHIPSGTGDTYLGVRVGLSKVRTEASSQALIYSPYHWGMAVGYDHYMTTWMSLGFEGSYLHMEPSRTKVLGTKYEQESFNIINFMVSAMFRL